MKKIILLSLMVVAAGAVQAETYHVEMVGAVEFSQVTFGIFADVVAGDAVLVQFDVDSDNYLDSTSFPTRGYVIDHPTYLLTIGGVSVGLQDPYAEGMTPYFVIRDNDPAVDGFFLSNGPDWPTGVFVNEPANVGDFFASTFEVAYTNDPLPSLEIGDAVGTYAYDSISSYYFSLNDGPFEAMFFEFVSLTISGGGVSVEPKSWSEVKSLFD